jgi:hypothetical protein
LTAGRRQEGEQEKCSHSHSWSFVVEMLDRGGAQRALADEQR